MMLMMSRKEFMRVVTVHDEEVKVKKIVIRGMRDKQRYGMEKREAKKKE